MESARLQRTTVAPETAAELFSKLVFGSPSTDFHEIFSPLYQNRPVQGGPLYPKSRIARYKEEIFQGEIFYGNQLIKW